MIDFEHKTYADILKNQMDRVTDSLDKREGSIIQTALGPASWYLEGVYLDLAFALNNAYADTAGGKYLDRIAEQTGIGTRKAPTYAVMKGEFDVRIPDGSRFSANGGSTYVAYTAEDCTGSDSAGYSCRMRCEVAGKSGNNHYGPIIPINYIPGLKRAEITEILSEGSEEETDDALRARILAKIKLPSTSGNKYDYYNWAMECENVGAAKVFPLANGPGTVKVVIADGGMTAAAPELIRKVADHIGELRPIGADVTVVSAIERAVNVSAKVHLSNGINLGSAQNAFHETLAEYLHGNAFDLSYVSIARIGSLLLGTAGIADYDMLQLNGVADNIRLEQEEIAVAGAVTLEVVI